MVRQRQGAIAAAAVVMLAVLMGTGEAFAQTGSGEEEEGGVFGSGEEAGVASPPPAEPAGVEQHIQALSSLDPAERAAAAQALGELGDASAVPALISALRSDPVAEVRGWAARSLHQIGTPEARAAVTAAARNDADERVRSLAGQLTGVAPAPPQPAQPAQPYGYGYGSPQVVPANQYAPYSQQVQRRRSTPGRGLRIAGWIVFSVTYGLSLMSGIGISADGGIEEGWPLFLPLVGPAIIGSQLWAEDEELIGVGILSWIMSLAQIAGLAMAIVGHVRGSRADDEDDEERAEPQRGLALVPGGPGGSPGLSLSAWF